MVLLITHAARSTAKWYENKVCNNELINLFFFFFMKHELKANYADVYLTTLFKMLCCGSKIFYIAYVTYYQSPG